MNVLVENRFLAERGNHWLEVSLSSDGNWISHRNRSFEEDICVETDVFARYANREPVYDRN